VLDIENLCIAFHDRLSNDEVVHNFNLHMERGEIVGIVGESGSGKTQTALSIAGLLKRSKTTATGKILLNGTDLLTLDRESLRKIQGKQISMIFQEPMTSLNPTMRIGRQVEESLTIHSAISKEERYELAMKVLRDVELPEPEVIYKKYPHELSGGQRQRVMIAAAIICGPELLIADEPTTALDVTIQAQILKLLKKINGELNMAILFISHDLRVIKSLCDRVVVMQRGNIVEAGKTLDVFNNPQDEYTKKLIASIPRRDKNG
jgi:ABC-type dipeptide/oligopeptide/nickel transport system ATPase component